MKRREEAASLDMISFCDLAQLKGKRTATVDKSDRIMRLQDWHTVITAGQQPAAWEPDPLPVDLYVQQDQASQSQYKCLFDTKSMSAFSLERRPN